METVSAQSLEKAAEVARKAIPFMAEKGIPVTPKNYFVWFEYFRGDNKLLITAIDELIAAAAPFTDPVMNGLYDKFFVTGLNDEERRKMEAEMRALDAANAATKKIIEPIAANLKQLSKTNLNYGEKLAGLATQMEDKTETVQVEQLVRVILDDTRKIASENKNISVQLDNYSNQINDLRQMLARAREEARLDDLTQVGNRRAFNESIEEELKWVKRNGAVSCVAMADVDFFKKINDTYGHPVGDKALMAIASILSESAGMDAEVFRYGGEEFAVILSGVKEDQGTAIMEQARQAVSSHEFVIRDKVTQITISIGVSTLRPDRTASESVKIADEAVYLAKMSGRNNVKAEKDLKKPSSGKA